MAKARVDGMSGNEDAGKARWKPSSKASKGKEPIVRRRVHLSVVLGITFCVIGGAVMASSFLLDWVEGPTGNEPLWELMERGGIYYLAFLVPLTGMLVALMSSLDVLAEKGRKGMKAPAALGSLTAAVLGTISLILVAIQINADMVEGSGASFGPAAFMSVFGAVLAVSGGMILTIDYLEARARKGRFTASGGSADLKAALRPATKGKTPRPNKMDKEPRSEVLAAEEPAKWMDEPKATGLECPNCYSPVQPNWRICPICGEELL